MRARVGVPTKNAYNLGRGGFWAPRPSFLRGPGGPGGSKTGLFGGSAGGQKRPLFSGFLAFFDKKIDKFFVANLFCVIFFYFFLVHTALREASTHKKPHFGFLRIFRLAALCAGRPLFRDKSRPLTRHALHALRT